MCCPLSYVGFLFSSISVHWNETQGSSNSSKLGWLSVYIVVMVMSLLGNSVIIHIVRTTPSMKNAISYLIMNQACADILISVTDALEELVKNATNDGWLKGTLGLVSCKTFRQLIFSSSVCSIWSLCAMAADRASKVVKPLRRSPVSDHLKAVIVSLWLWSLTSPLLFAPLASVQGNEGRLRCFIDESVHTFPLWKIAAIVTYSLNFLLPLFIMVVLYPIICWRLWSRKIPGEGASQNRRQAEAMETAKKVTRMLIVLLVVFILCWIPYFTIVILKGFHQLLTGASLSAAVFISRAYSAINPYIFISFNETCRQKLKTLVRKRFRKRINTADLEVSVVKTLSWEIPH